MIYEALFGSEEGEPGLVALSLGTLLLLSVATSIDALAVGVTFAVLGTPILVPVLVIGLVTAVISALGVVIGSTFGHIFERKIEIAGGVILIGIGLRILFGGSADHPVSSRIRRISVAADLAAGSSGTRRSSSADRTPIPSSAARAICSSSNIRPFMTCGVEP